MTPLMWAVIATVCAIEVWHGAVASAFFARSGRERWRGWVPVVRDVEFFRWGGRPVHVVGLLFVPVVAVYAVVVRGLALHRIGRRFGWTTGMAVLGALLPPVWTTSAAARSAGSPSGSDDPDADTGENAEHASARRRAARAERAVTKPQRPPKPPRAPKAPRAPRPVAAPEQVETARPAFAPPEQVTATAPAAVGYDLLVWHGPRIPLTATRVVVGRAPSSPDPAVQCVTLDDPSNSLSGSHAEFFRVNEQWFVTDLNSTNGVAVPGRGSFTRLAPNQSTAVQGEVRMGDVRVKIEATPH